MRLYQLEAAKRAAIIHEIRAIEERLTRAMRIIEQRLLLEAMRQEKPNPPPYRGILINPVSERL